MLKKLCVMTILLAFYGQCADEMDPAKVKRIPPPGIQVKDADRTELQAGVDDFAKEIAALRDALKTKPQLLALLPDVQVYHKAVHDALAYNEIYNEKEIAGAKNVLKVGRERAAALKEGSAPWTTAVGPVVRGYVSKIDGSVQPYGLIVPGPAVPSAPTRLDFWFHGRGETLSELAFVMQRQSSMGEFAPRDTFVLHPYGRYCNANKFAGEIDTLEALEHAKKYYRIDENRITVRGFSMGGAACWQFAVHYADRWCAAAPGAGFSETPDFIHAWQNPDKPTDFEQKLWHIYDATHYAANLFNLPTVAYSGELDGQKQAADMMAKALEKEHIEMTHIIGPGAHHNYEAKAKEEVNRRIDSIAARGRNPVPEHIKLVTYTLRYNRMYWVTIDALTQHWERAFVEGRLVKGGVEVETKNVSEVSFNFAPGMSPFEVTAPVKVKIDNQELEAPAPQSDRSFSAHYRLTGRTWKMLSAAELKLSDPPLAKKHGLQGPIDDAFMDSFIMVTPTGAGMNEKSAVWVKNESAHAIDHWRRQYRGEARVMADDKIGDAEIKNSNLILWGDPNSNKVLAKIAEKLPIKWSAKEITAGNDTYSSADNVLIMIYPNPLNPEKYVVLNSGFTFRENEYLNNAKQNAKLPDWAVVDVTNGANSKWPGKVVKAEFFDEGWGVKK